MLDNSVSGRGMPLSIAAGELVTIDSERTSVDARRGAARRERVNRDVAVVRPSAQSGSHSSRGGR